MLSLYEYQKFAHALHGIAMPGEDTAALPTLPVVGRQQFPKDPHGRPIPITAEEKKTKAAAATYVRDWLSTLYRT